MPFFKTSEENIHELRWSHLRRGHRSFWNHAAHCFSDVNPTLNNAYDAFCYFSSEFLRSRKSVCLLEKSRGGDLTLWSWKAAALWCYECQQSFCSFFGSVLGTFSSFGHFSEGWFLVFVLSLRYDAKMSGAWCPHATASLREPCCESRNDFLVSVVATRIYFWLHNLSIAIMQWRSRDCDSA